MSRTALGAWNFLSTAHPRRRMFKAGFIAARCAAFEAKFRLMVKVIALDFLRFR
jgi:hypothetical protein